MMDFISLIPQCELFYYLFGAIIVLSIFYLIRLIVLRK